VSSGANTFESCLSYSRAKRVPSSVDIISERAQDSKLVLNVDVILSLEGRIVDETGCIQLFRSGLRFL